MGKMLTEFAAAKVAAFSFFRRGFHRSPIIRGLVESSSLPRPKRVLRAAPRAVHLLVLLSLLTTTFIPARTGAAAALRLGEEGAEG